MCFGTWKLPYEAVTAFQLYETEQMSFPLEFRNYRQLNINLAINFNESSTIQHSEIEVNEHILNTSFLSVCYSPI